ncbi:hypothetical protein EJ03DRAFT_359956 [Teratosphaeria nubilosa]|uniref:Trichothecene 3-O-acetyltransferase n=1 Tax=Teratosphaeria nubilosa TaxID=161662 RepID=A0A6G1KT54_9PEZI|nr:hypothetical protein EJ03DRAFT_359956 [Teratosphaeria nubilosa]
MAPDQVTIPLTPYDNIMPRIYARTLYILKTRSDAGSDIKALHSKLDASLDRTIAELPFLGGKVFLAQPDGRNAAKGRLELRLSPAEEGTSTSCLRFQDLRQTLNIEDLLDAGIPDDTLDGGTLNAGSLIGDLEAGADVLVCQANFVEGGCILSVGIHHSVCDGAGQSTVMKAWTRHLLQDGQRKHPTIERPVVDSRVADKELLFRLWQHAGNTTDERAYEEAPDALWRFLGVNDIKKPPRLDPAREAATAQEEIVTGIYYISGEAFAAMKHEAAKPVDDYSNALSRQITANDALMAFLWQSTMRARFPPEQLTPGDRTEAMLDSTFDGRGKFSDDLPPDYVGNLVLMSTAAMPLHELVHREANIAKPACRVRSALNTVSTARLHDAFKLAASLPDYSSLTFPFATFAGCELCITSIVNDPAFELDFGADFSNHGHPVSVRPPRSEFAAICRRCIALPRRTTGGFEVLIAMFASEMQRLAQDASFTRWARCMTH